ncbi:MAG TPA: DinB family protein [Pyrinomonadaceae bacterium]|nr:DinB family protein [Pyrinomonadaceae bacterium]
MSIDRLIETWKEVRAGFVAEVSQIPEDKFSFRATPDTRTVAELIRHVVEVQKMLVGECARPDGDLTRQSFADHLNEHASDIASVTDKNGLLELLRGSMETAEASMRSASSQLDAPMRRFDGKERTRQDILNFAIAHEMYHRGQFTVYARLLNIEPALTQYFNKLMANANQSKAVQNAS